MSPSFNRKIVWRNFGERLYEYLFCTSGIQKIAVRKLILNYVAGWRPVTLSEWSNSEIFVEKSDHGWRTPHNAEKPLEPASYAKKIYVNKKLLALL